MPFQDRDYAGPMDSGNEITANLINAGFIQFGTIGTRPLPGNLGVVYVTSTTWYRDDGNDWVQMPVPGGAGADIHVVSDDPPNSSLWNPGDFWYEY